jgi:hypothetical protein
MQYICDTFRVVASEKSRRKISDCKTFGTLMSDAHDHVGHIRYFPIFIRNDFVQSTIINSEASTTGWFADEMDL